MVIPLCVIIGIIRYVYFGAGSKYFTAVIGVLIPALTATFRVGIGHFLYNSRIAAVVYSSIKHKLGVICAYIIFYKICVVAVRVRQKLVTLKDIIGNCLKTAVVSVDNALCV